MLYKTPNFGPHLAIRAAKAWYCENELGIVDERTLLKNFKMFSNLE